MAIVAALGIPYKRVLRGADQTGFFHHCVGKWVGARDCQFFGVSGASDCLNWSKSCTSAWQLVQAWICSLTVICSLAFSEFSTTPATCSYVKCEMVFSSRADKSPDGNLSAHLLPWLALRTLVRRSLQGAQSCKCSLIISNWSAANFCWQYPTTCCSERWFTGAKSRRYPHNFGHI